MPGAITDGADAAEALREASDCLTEALATRIAHGEAIPPASPAEPGQHVVSPDPTIALKAALYMAMYRRDMTVADLAELLGMGDWHQAARLIDPKRSLAPLTSPAAAHWAHWTAGLPSRSRPARRRDRSLSDMTLKAMQAQRADLGNLLNTLFRHLRGVSVARKPKPKLAEHQKREAIPARRPDLIRHPRAKAKGCNEPSTCCRGSPKIRRLR